jgi:hypothetical protein
MNQWKDHKGSVVMFTENHWMSEECMKIYLDRIRGLFPGKKVGITFDYAPSHSKVLMQWILDENVADKTSTTLVVDYIDPCLTSIYQPCDIVVNRY